jgi:hypothetical protein
MYLNASNRKTSHCETTSRVAREEAENGEEAIIDRAEMSRAKRHCTLTDFALFVSSPHGINQNVSFKSLLRC